MGLCHSASSKEGHMATGLSRLYEIKCQHYSDSHPSLKPDETYECIDSSGHALYSPDSTKSAAVGRSRSTTQILKKQHSPCFMGCSNLKGCCWNVQCPMYIQAKNRRNIFAGEMEVGPRGPGRYFQIFRM